VAYSTAGTYNGSQTFLTLSAGGEGRPFRFSTDLYVSPVINISCFVPSSYYPVSKLLETKSVLRAPRESKLSTTSVQSLCRNCSNSSKEVRTLKNFLIHYPPSARFSQPLLTSVLNNIQLLFIFFLFH
jgi:hypothetical protein